MGADHNWPGTPVQLHCFCPVFDQVRQAHAARHEITIDDLIAEFDELRLLAIKNNQTSAAVAATAEKRRLLFGDLTKVELAGPGDSPVQIEAAAAVRALLEAVPELGVMTVVPALASAVPPGLTPDADADPASLDEDGQP